jgi:flagellar hook protein FlgE
MFESIYVGLSGLASFSRNLTVIGNNVSNLNSPGFKASQLQFADLMYAQLGLSRGASGDPMQIGSGVNTGGTRVLFTQGALRETGSQTDVAVQGNGFFVLRAADGKTTYTRDGSFEFGADGMLTSRASGARVGALVGGGLQDVSIAGLRHTLGKPTSTVRLIDNLNVNDTTHDLTVTVVDSSGTNSDVKLVFTNAQTSDGLRIWKVRVQDARGQELKVLDAEGNELKVKDDQGNEHPEGEIRFKGDGSPADGFNTLKFTLRPTGLAATDIVLDFGSPSGISGATSFSSSDSTLKLGSQDGFTSGSLTEAKFDAEGVLVASYSNGQTARGPRLALAFFESPQELEGTGAGVFENRSNQRVTLGNPRSDVFGSVTGGSLESANVDLAQQFSELIVTQRGYQASSQVITATNEMIQQLFDIKGRR